MTVSELIDALSKCSPHAPVILPPLIRTIEASCVYEDEDSGEVEIS